MRGANVFQEYWDRAQATREAFVDGWCKDRFSAYKIPRRLLLVAELPRSAMGPITKPAVIQLFRGADKSE
ncbi:MAG: hypothetical protein AAF989_09720 [Planctomycetota bacterium]